MSKRGRLAPWLVWPTAWDAGDARARGWMWRELKRTAGELGLRVIDAKRKGRSAGGEIFAPDVQVRPCSRCGAPAPFVVWGEPRCPAHADS